jgi:FkbM family methyltransferase
MKYNPIMQDETNFLDYVRRENPDVIVPTLVDVGSAQGDFTHAFLQRFSNGHALCIDPNQRAFDICRNRFFNDRDVTVVLCGLSNERKDSVAFYEANPENGCSSFYTRTKFEIDKDMGLQEKQVELKVYDDVLKDVPVFYLKIDVEGYELKVLHGARKSLAAGLIKYIQFEYWYNEDFHNGPVFGQIIKLLQGYTVYDGDFNVVTETPMDGIVRNYLAVRNK